MNPAGQKLAVIADLPAGGDPFPAVVLAPGQGYHMELPALEAVARSMAAQGIAVFRFNWAYFTARPQGQPSDDLSRELQDLQAVLAAARAHRQVAADRVVVAGKSLGSAVAWLALREDARLRGALLLTPLCSRLRPGETRPQPEALENYPGFEAERRPTLWVAGHQDPLCAPSVLYDFARSRGDAARVAVVGGDHGFETRSAAPAAAAAALQRSLAAVAALSAGFAADITGP